MADRLLDPRHQQLVQRPLRTVRDAVELLGQPSAHVQPQHLGLHRTPSDNASGVVSSTRDANWRTSFPYRAENPSVDGSRSWLTTVIASFQPSPGAPTI